MSEKFQDSFSWMTFKFKSVRVIEDIINPGFYSLKTEVAIKPGCDEQDLSIALEKIHFWFDHIMNSAIMFSQDNAYAARIVLDDEGRMIGGNYPMVFPEEPTEDLMAIVFLSKLNALGGGKIMFMSVELSSDTRENLTCGFAGDPEDYLPTMDEWIGERKYHSVPWWGRNDGSTFDMNPAPDADLTSNPCFGFDMSMIEKQILKEQSDAAIIIRPEFKPRVIHGGNHDNKD